MERQPFRAIVALMAIVVGLLAAAVGIVMACIGFVVACISLLLTPVWLVLHFLLRACGRQGFYERKDGEFRIGPSRKGFEKHADRG